jgi:hypothetical protein
MRGSIFWCSTAIAYGKSEHTGQDTDDEPCPTFRLV